MKPSNLILAIMFSTLLGAQSGRVLFNAQSSEGGLIKTSASSNNTNATAALGSGGADVSSNNNTDHVNSLNMSAPTAVAVSSCASFQGSGSSDMAEAMLNFGLSMAENLPLIGDVFSFFNSYMQLGTDLSKSSTNM